MAWVFNPFTGTFDQAGGTTGNFVTNGAATGKITAQTGEPSTPATGDLWIDTDDTAFAVNPYLKNYTEVTYEANSSTAITIDMANGNVQNITITGNTTITLPACPATSTYSWALTLRLIQDGTGGRTITCVAPSATTLHWLTGDNLEPTYATTANDINVVTFESWGTDKILGHWGGSKAL